MEHYTKKGLYNSYDKNHKERDTLDYYATPPRRNFKHFKQIKFKP